MKFLLGLALGLTGGLLFAPAPGQETRRKLRREADEFAGESQERFQHAAEKVTETARDKAGQIGSAVGRQAAESVVESMLGNPEKRSA